MEGWSRWGPGIWGSVMPGKWPVGEIGDQGLAMSDYFVEARAFRIVPSAAQSSRLR
jgi:hypothetical protein